MEYFEVLEQLIEKQKIFYTRLSLSDDPDAVEVVENMKQSAVMLGGDPSLDMSYLFDDLIGKVQKMKDELEAQEG
jgi:hypothetical protein